MKRVIKGNIISYLILLAIAIMAMVSVRKCDSIEINSTRDYNEIKSDTLRIVTNIFHNEECANLVNYELAKLIGEESGLRYKIDTINSLAKSITLLNSNNYDIIARPIYATTELKDNLLFSDIIHHENNNLVIVQRKDGEIKTNLDLAKKVINIIDDQSISMIINNIAYEIGDSIQIVVKPNCSNEQLIAMVADSTIDYAVCSNRIAKQMKNILPQIDVSTKITIPLPQAWAVRHSSPILKDSLNVWLEEIKKSEKYIQLMNNLNF